MPFDLYGKRLNKKQAEKLNELFEYLSNMHENVDKEGYEAFCDGQCLVESYDDVVNLADDLFISFGYADKRMEDKWYFNVHFE